MPAKPRPRPVTAARQAQRRRGSDEPTLPGLTEAVEVYRRIVEPAGAAERPSGRGRGRRARAG
jgi:hypothetical protein